MKIVKIASTHLDLEAITAIEDPEQEPGGTSWSFRVWLKLHDEPLVWRSLSKPRSPHWNSDSHAEYEKSVVNLRIAHQDLLAQWKMLDVKAESLGP